LVFSFFGLASPSGGRTLKIATQFFGLIVRVRCTLQKAHLNGCAFARQVKSFFLFYELVLSQAKKPENQGPLTLK